MERARPRHILGIDLLRFACAAMVVLYHAGTGNILSPGAHAGVLLSSIDMPRRWVSSSSFGWVGVELFFVISGIVIARSALGSMPSEFAKRRVLRLAPAAWICATVTAGILATTGQFPAMQLAGEWLRSISFWPIGEQIDGVYWTLGIEACFYLVIGSILCFRRDRVAIEWGGIALGLASSLFWIAMLAGVGARGMDGIRGVQLLLLPHGCLFALGIMLWSIAENGMTRRRFGLTILFLFAALIEILAHSAERSGSMPADYGPGPALLIFLAGFFWLLAVNRLQAPLARYLNAKWVATLGLMTYPLYLIHQEAGAAIIAYLAHHGWRYESAAACSMLLALALSWLVARLAEPRLRAALQRGWNAVVSARRDPVPDTLPSASPPAG